MSCLITASLLYFERNIFSRWQASYARFPSCPTNEFTQRKSRNRILDRNEITVWNHWSNLVLKNLSYLLEHRRLLNAITKIYLISLLYLLSKNNFKSVSQYDFTVNEKLIFILVQFSKKFHKNFCKLHEGS